MTAKEKIILLDVDGVIGDFDSIVTKYLKSKYNINVDKTSQNTWDILDFDTVRPYKQEILDFVNNTDVISFMDTYNGSFEFVNSLRKLGTVIACTASIYYGNFPSNRSKWLMKHFDFKFSDIVFAYRKSLIHGDVLIDDKLSNVFDWALKWENKEGIIFQTPGRPNSEPEAAPGNVSYCSDYESVLEKIKRL